MLQGEWTAITPESAEDVVCDSAPSQERRFGQVKTVENPSQLWTPARLCQPERAGEPETSILGRLITEKDFPESCVLILATNERVSPDLRPLVHGSTGDRSAISAELERRLSGAQPRGRSLRWCVDRFWIEECENTADGLEAQIHRLVGLAASSHSRPLLTQEVDALLDRIVSFVQRRSREHLHQRIEREEFESQFVTWAEEISLQTEVHMTSPDESLRAKLTAAGLDNAEISGFEGMRFRFSRARRAAVAVERTSLDEVADEIAMACIEIRHGRQAGTTEPGLASLQATLAKVESLHSARGWDDKGISLSLAYGALHDITGRCQNRYVDD